MNSLLARWVLAIALLAACSGATAESDPVAAQTARLSVTSTALPSVSPTAVAMPRGHVPEPLVRDQRWICSEDGTDDDTVDCLSRQVRALIGALDAQFALLNRPDPNFGLDREDFELDYAKLRSNDICRRAGSGVLHGRCSIDRYESLQVTLSHLDWLETPSGLLPLLPHQMWGEPLSSFEPSCEVRVRVDALAVDWVRLAYRGFAPDGEGAVETAQVELISMAGLGPARGVSSFSWTTAGGETVQMSIVLAGTHYHDRRHDSMAGVWFGTFGTESEPMDVYGYWWLNFDDGVHGVGEIRNLEAGTFGESLIAEIVPCP